MPFLRWLFFLSPSFYSFAPDPHISLLLRSSLSSDDSTTSANGVNTSGSNREPATAEECGDMSVVRLGAVRCAVLRDSDFYELGGVREQGGMPMASV